MRRHALVTGGSRGIGEGIVRRLREEELEVLAPPRAELDLADRTSIERWLAAHAELAVDVLVLDAAENVPASLPELDLARWERTIEVNLGASFLLARALLPGMAARGFGRVVAISSVYAAHARPGRAAYSVSKAGLEALVRAIAVEFGDRGVLANAIAPGFVDTELTRQNNSSLQIEQLASRTVVGRLARADEIAEVVAFLASARNSYMTGQTITVDGGFGIK